MGYHRIVGTNVLALYFSPTHFVVILLRRRFNMSINHLSGQYLNEARVLESRIKDLKAQYKNEKDMAARRVLSARIWALIPILIENRSSYKSCRGYSDEKGNCSDRA